MNAGKPRPKSFAEDGAMARAGLEPDVEDVALLAERCPAALRARGRRRAAAPRPDRVNQASAPSARNRSRKCRTVSAVSNWVWHDVQPKAGIGTPQDRWRLMHQSGRSETIASIRVLPHVGQPVHLADRLQASGRAGRCDRRR